jgi:hypothetical protein
VVPPALVVLPTPVVPPTFVVAVVPDVPPALVVPLVELPPETAAPSVLTPGPPPLSQAESPRRVIPNVKPILGLRMFSIYLRLGTLSRVMV